MIFGIILYFSNPQCCISSISISYFLNPPKSYLISLPPVNAVIAELLKSDETIAVGVNRVEHRRDELLNIEHQSLKIDAIPNIKIWTFNNHLNKIDVQIY